MMKTRRKVTSRRPQSAKGDLAVAIQPTVDGVLMLLLDSERLERQIAGIPAEIKLNHEPFSLLEEVQKRLDARFARILGNDQAGPALPTFIKQILRQLAEVVGPDLNIDPIPLGEVQPWTANEDLYVYERGAARGRGRLVFDPVRSIRAKDLNDDGSLKKSYRLTDDTEA